MHALFNVRINLLDDGNKDICIQANKLIMRKKRHYEPWNHFSCF